jgi:hypothetical protein
MWLRVDKFTKVVASENKVSLIATVLTTSDDNPTVMFQHLLPFTKIVIESFKPTITRTHLAFDCAKCKHRYLAQVQRQINKQLDF